jgi:TFIIF-interacting CTD phosphatase-like protein
MNLVLDLDETLIKSFHYKISYINEIKLKSRQYKLSLINIFPELRYILLPNDSFDNFYLTDFIINDTIYIIIKRPYLKEFIDIMYNKFKLTLYSVATKYYVDIIVNEIGKLLGYNPFISVFSNINRYSPKVKSLSMINLDHNKSVIIDDNIHVWKDNKNKIYQIPPFIGYHKKVYNNECFICKLFGYSDYKYIINDNELEKIIKFNLLSSIINNY